MSAGLLRRLGIHLYCMLTRPLGEERLGACARLRYAILAESELLEHCTDQELDLRADKVRAAFARGDVCVGGFEEECLAAYVWYSFSRAPHMRGVWVEVDERSRYAYKAFVRPSHRGRGLGNELYREAGALCPRRGRTLAVSFVAPDNRPSLRASRRVGWSVQGYVGYAQWPGAFRAFALPGACAPSARFIFP